MSKLRAILTIVAALVLASFAAMLAGRYVGNKTRQNTHQVAVAKSTIELGTPISTDLVAMVDWPRDSTPDGTFSTLTPLLTEPTTKAPRVARTTILKGEPILELRLAPIGSLGGLAAVIAPGNQAITVRVNDVVGVGGFALPGSYVDVLVNTTQTSGSNTVLDESISKIVLNHILVLAAAEEISRDESKPKVVNAVTLEVTPEQAERIDLARSVGTLSLVLRNPIDVGQSGSPGVDKRMLLGNVPWDRGNAVVPTPDSPEFRPVPPTPVAKAKPTRPATERIEVIRGTTRGTQSIER